MDAGAAVSERMREGAVGAARPRRRPTRLLALALILAVVGCASRVANPFSAERSGSDQVRIDIDNQSFNDFRAYVVTVRGHRLLGQVPGKSERTFTIDWPQLDQVRVRMEFLAARTLETNSVDAAPGDRLQAIVPPQMRGVSLFRRRAP